MSQESQVKCESGPEGFRLSFEESLYPKEAVFGAAYVLLDRAFVHLDRTEGQLLVVLRPKPGVSLSAELLAGEFENEALAQTWRREILRENRTLLETVSSRALGGAAGPPGLDDLLDASLGDLGDAFDDPLGIAVSWEEKYGKKAKPAEGEAGNAAEGSSAEQSADKTEEPKP